MWDRRVLAPRVYRIPLETIGDVAIVKKIVYGLNDNGFFDPCFCHRIKQKFDRTLHVWGDWAILIGLLVIAPDVKMGIDNHNKPP